MKGLSYWLPQRDSLVILWSNFFRHYDTALFGLLTPLFAPYFFPDNDPVIAMLLMYGSGSLALTLRPLGACFFGILARRKSPEFALKIPLYFLSFLTLVIAFLPTYSSWGIFAPIVFIATRSAQSFFAAGASSIAALYLIELEDGEKACRQNGYFQLTTMLGIFMAAVMSAVIYQFPEGDYYWRIPFLLGVFTGFTGRFSVKVKKEEISHERAREAYFSWSQLQWIGKLLPLTILTNATYEIPFVLFVALVPLITPIERKDIVSINTFLILIDAAFLIIFSRFGDLCNKKKWIGTFAFLLAASSLPLFYMLEGAGGVSVTLIRFSFVVLGVGFLIPLHGWIYELLPKEGRYFLWGLCNSLGAVVGKSTTAMCLYAWQITGTAAAPGAIMAGISFLAFLSVWRVETGTSIWPLQNMPLEAAQRKVELGYPVALKQPQG